MWARLLCSQKEEEVNVAGAIASSNTRRCPTVKCDRSECGVCRLGEAMQEFAAEGIDHMEWNM